MDTAINHDAGRRRFLRIPEMHPVLIQTCDSIGVLRGTFAEQALTLDYSQGGMRILVNRKLPADSLLRFDFGYDFVVPQLQGIAKICWSRKVNGKDQGIEAGVAFQDHFSQAVMSVQKTIIADLLS